MDDRQSEILVGKGLQDSRLNEEFIAWLEKYGTRLLYIVLIIVGGYVGWSKWIAWQQDKTDQAFAEYDAARGQRMSNGMLTGSPTNLLAVAEQYKSRAAIWELASLDAADIYLGSARQGIRPGGEMGNPDDVLDESETTELTNLAAGLFREVLKKLGKRENRIMLTQRARWGLATALISLGDLEEADLVMAEYAETAMQQHMGIQIAAAENRMSTIPSLRDLPKLYSADELPKSAIAPVAPTTDVQIPGLQTDVVGPLSDPERDPLLSGRYDEETGEATDEQSTEAPEESDDGAVVDPESSEDDGEEQPQP